ncbi:hypothetical protein WAF17_16170 [Bernardetia sp. ABR2-2B]|uniref:hypothetical protein n=1 Tax=Bernardetia sp. ABR2-2B TaxID=3127472 RepID=UPI0030CD9B65
MTNKNSNIIINSKISKDVNQVQNNYSKKEQSENTFTLAQAFQEIKQLRKEVKALKLQVKKQKP